MAILNQNIAEAGKKRYADHCGGHRSKSSRRTKPQSMIAMDLQKQKDPHMIESQIDQPQQIQPKQKRKYNYTKKTGRPGKFGQIKIPQLRKILEMGATDEQIANFFNVSYGTFKSYKKDNPEFSAALKEWKRQADERVVDSLFHRALGYEHPSEEIHIIKNKVVRVATRKIYPPDTTAQIFWLKNRQPDQWRDKQDHDHTGEVNFNFNLSGIISQSERAYASVN